MSSRLTLERQPSPTAISVHSESAQETLLRSLSVTALLGIAALHFLQIVPTFQQTPLLGYAYSAFIIACVALAARLIAVATPRDWLATAALGAAAIVGYAFTRVASTPLDNQDVGNWACALGLAALFTEGSLIALSLSGAGWRLRRRSAGRTVGPLSGTSRL